MNNNIKHLHFYSVEAMCCLTILMMATLTSGYVVPCNGAVNLTWMNSNDPNISFSNCAIPLLSWSVSGVTNSNFYLSSNAKANISISFESLSLANPAASSNNVSIYITNWPINFEVSFRGVWSNLVLIVTNSPVRTGVTFRNSTLTNSFVKVTKYFIAALVMDLEIPRVLFVNTINATNTTWIVDDAVISIRGSQGYVVFWGNSVFTQCHLSITNVAAQYQGVLIGFSPAMYQVDLTNSTLVIANTSVTAAEFNALTQASLLGFSFSNMINVSIFMTNVTSVTSGSVIALNATVATQLYISVTASFLTTLTNQVRGAATVFISTTTLTASTIVITNSALNATAAIFTVTNCLVTASTIKATTLALTNCSLFAQNTGSIVTVAAFTLWNTAVTQGSSILMTGCDLRAFNGSDGNLFSGKFTAGIAILQTDVTNGSVVSVKDSTISAAALSGAFDAAEFTPNVVGLFGQFSASGGSALLLTNVRLSAFGGTLFIAQFSNVSIKMSNVTMDVELLSFALYNSTVVNSSTVEIRDSRLNMTSTVIRSGSVALKFSSIVDSSVVFQGSVLNGSAAAALTAPELVAGIVLTAAPLIRSSLIIANTSIVVLGADVVTGIVLTDTQIQLSVLSIEGGAALSAAGKLQAFALNFFADMVNSTLRVASSTLTATVLNGYPSSGASGLSIAASILLATDPGKTASQLVSDSTFLIARSSLSTVVQLALSGNSALGINIVVNFSSWRNVSFLMSGGQATAQNGNLFQMIGSTFILNNSLIEFNAALLNATGFGVVINVGFMGGATFLNASLSVINASQFIATAQYTTSSIFSTLPFIISTNVAVKDATTLSNFSLVMLNTVLRSTCSGSIPASSSAVAGSVLLGNAVGIQVRVRSCMGTVTGIGGAAFVQFNGTSDGSNVTIAASTISVVASSSQTLVSAVVVYFQAPCSNCTLTLFGGSLSVSSTANPSTTTIQYAGQVIFYFAAIEGMVLAVLQVTSSAATPNVASKTSSASIIGLVNSTVVGSSITMRAVLHSSDIGSSAGFSSVLSFALSNVRSSQFFLSTINSNCKGAVSASVTLTSMKPPGAIVAGAIVIVQSSISEGSAILVNSSTFQSSALGATFMAIVQSTISSGSSVIVGQSKIDCSCSGIFSVSGFFSFVFNVSLLSATFLLTQSFLTDSLIVFDGCKVSSITTSFTATNIKIVLSRIDSSTLLVRNTSMVATVANGVLPDISNYLDASSFLLTLFDLVGGPYSGNIVLEASALVTSTLSVSHGSTLSASSMTGLSKIFFGNIMIINGSSVTGNAAIQLSDSQYSLDPASPRVLDYAVGLCSNVLVSASSVDIRNFTFRGSPIAVGFSGCSISELHLTVDQPFQGTTSKSIVNISGCGSVTNSTLVFTKCTIVDSGTLLHLQSSSLVLPTITARLITTLRGGNFMTQVQPSTIADGSIHLSEMSLSSSAPALVFTSIANSSVIIENSSFVQLLPGSAAAAALAFQESSIQFLVSISNCSFDQFSSAVSTDATSNDTSSRITVYCSLWNGHRLTRGRLGPSVWPFLNAVVPRYLSSPDEMCDMSLSISMSVSSSRSASETANHSSNTATFSPPPTSSTSPTRSKTLLSSPSSTILLTPSQSVTKTPPLTPTLTVPADTWTPSLTTNSTVTVTTTLIPPTPTESFYIQQVPCPAVAVESLHALTDSSFSTGRVSIDLLLPGPFKWWNSPWRYNHVDFIRFIVDESPLPQPFGFQRVLGSRLGEYNFSFVSDHGAFRRIQVVFPVAPDYSILVGETVHVQVSPAALQHQCLGPAAYGSFKVTPMNAAPFLSLVNMFGVVGGAVSVANAGSSDAQLLALIGMSPCASAAAHASASSIQYLLSPFVDYGLSAMILGNIGLVFCVWLVQKLVVDLILIPRILRRQSTSDPMPSVVPPKYAAWSTARFPNLTFVVAMFLHQGTTSAVFVSFGSSVAANIVVGFCGFVYVGAFYLAIRSIRSVERSAPSTIRGKFILYKLPYGATRKLFHPVGQWTTSEFRRCFGRIFGGMQGQYVWWSLYPSIMIICFNVINAVSFGRGNCHVQSGLLAVVTGATFVIVAWRRPFRIPFTTFLACTSLLCTTLLLLISAVNSTVNTNEMVLLTIYLSFAQTLVTVVRLAHTAYILYWERAWNAVVDDTRAAAEHRLADLVPDEHLGQILELHPPEDVKPLVDMEQCEPVKDIPDHIGIKRPRWVIAAELRTCQEAILKLGTVIRVLQHRPTAGADLFYRLESVVNFAAEHRRKHRLILELEAAD